MVYFCYIDESGTAQIPGNTSHFVLAGISIPIKYWGILDRRINAIKTKYGLINQEVHTGWIMRSYLDQGGIPNFDSLNHDQRRSEVDRKRRAELLRLQRSNPKLYRQFKKNYKHTYPYRHLAYAERMNFIYELADLIGKQTYIRIFAECVDKIYFDPLRSLQPIDEQALEQIVSRFETYMQNVDKGQRKKGVNEEIYGVLIHDNNETVSRRHTDLVKKFHNKGTLWTDINHIIETPLFVNSELTGMIQMADLCAIALRRYFENGETNLIDRIKPRIDTKRNKIVGVRHFTDVEKCDCYFCRK